MTGAGAARAMGATGESRTMEDLQAIEWFGMRLWVPAEWEIASHSVRSERGRLVFVDRRQERLQLSWAAVRRPPDLAQAMADYRRRDSERQPDSTFRDIVVGRWAGFRSASVRRTLTRAGLYDGPRRLWVEMAIAWPDGHRAELERAILERFELRQPDAPTSRWRAFRMDVEVPREWTIQEVDAKPADVSLRFASGRDRAIVRRTGMLEAWFDGNLESLIRQSLGAVATTCRQATHNGHPAVRSESRERGRALVELFGRPRTRSNLAWVCPTAHALYHVACRFTARRPVDPASLTVRCCPPATARRGEPGDGGKTP